MQRNQLEAWVYQILDRVTDKKPIEDDRIELKREWPDAEKSARRIAAHANASRGQPVLWLVGVDEKAGTVPGSNLGDFATWHAKVLSQFDDGVSPDLAVHVNVPVQGTSVAALYFETDRAPYVVKNPSGGHITFEVPWRTGTSTYSATRSQLLRLLGPLQQVPALEVMRAWCVVSQDATTNHWQGYLDCYITPKTQDLLAVPRHRRRLSVSTPVGRFEIASWIIQDAGSLITATKDEVLIQGPGRIGGRFSIVTSAADVPDGDVVFDAEFLPTEFERPAKATLIVPRVQAREGEDSRWSVGDWAQ
jgi:hypothetical protein